MKFTGDPEPIPRDEDAIEHDGAAAGVEGHTLRLEGGRAGDWSAVIMKLGSPAKIGIWVSEDASTASDCDAWLKAVDLPTLDLTGFETVESGTLTPPAGLVP